MIVVAVAACGRFGFAPPDVGGGGDARSADTYGSRLAPRYLVAPDGSRVFAGVYDALLAAPCSWGGYTDGVPACAPLSAEITSIFHADAGCTQIAASIPSYVYCDGISYAHTFDGTLHPITAELATGYMASPTCMPAVFPKRYFSFGSPITTRAVTAVLGEALGNRLAMTQYTAEDGSIVTTMPLRDQVLDVQCQIESDVGQSDPACLPMNRAVRGYADAGCTQPIWYAPRSDARYGFTGDGSICGAVVVHRVTNPRIGPVYATGTGCTQLGGTDYIYDDDGIVPRSELAIGKFDTVGVGRVRERVWIGDAGDTVPLRASSSITPYIGAPALYFDTVEQRPCAVRPDTADRIRCLPDSSSFVAYADATCATAPMLGHSYACDGRAPYTMQQAVVPMSCSRAGGLTAFTRAPGLYATIGSTCAAVDQGRTTGWSPAGAADLTQFAELTFE